MYSRALLRSALKLLYFVGCLFFLQSNPWFMNVTNKDGLKERIRVLIIYLLVIEDAIGPMHFNCDF